MVPFTICWECKNATGGCSWTQSFIPVTGWKATIIKPTSTKPYSTYIVEECPEFERDAYDGGIKRIPKE